MGRRHSGPRYYAVASGRSNGIYNSWDDCSREVTGHRGAVFKSFGTKAEAEAFMESHARRDPPSDDDEHYASARYARRTESPPQHSHSSSSTYSAPPARAYVPERRVAPAAVPYASSSSYASSRTATRTSPSASSEHSHSYHSHHRHSVQEVYVDGACSRNGQGGAVGGYGGYYGDSDKRNFSLPLPVGDVQTNNRGEMRAVIHVMDQHLSSGEELPPLRIHTDSRYVLDGLTQYSKKWTANGFRLANNEPVKNQDLWKQMIELRDSYNNRYARQEKRPSVYTASNTKNDGSEAVELRHVKGHSRVHGNEQADQLAVRGAKRRRE